MRYPCATCLAAVVLLASTARADWLVLKDGAELRGVDYKPGKKALFTLETGQVIAVDPEQVAEVRKSPAGEQVDFNGRQVTLREKIRLVQEERKARLKAAGQDLESWALSATRQKDGKLDEAGRKARDRFLALADDEREAALTAALRSSSLKSVKLLAAGELAKHKGVRPAEHLVQAAVKDQLKAVREAAFASLKAVAEPGTGDRFVPFLRSHSLEERVRAAGALEAFPARRAVPVMIVNLQKVWDDFGRGYFFQGEHRAFIKDYNLVSGGTGFSIIEVADPEIATLTTGVVLDVKVRKVEANAYARALKAITGEDFGPDPAPWRKWWRAQGKAAAK